MCSGTSPDDRLVEFVELPPTHPFFVATQAHPEFKSRPDRPHPLFAAFVAAARDRAEGRRPRLPLRSRARRRRRAVTGRRRAAERAEFPGRRARARSATPGSSRSTRRTSTGPTATSSTASSCTIPARWSWCRSTPTATRAAGAPVPRRGRRRAARGPGGQARRRRRAARGDRAPRARGGDRLRAGRLVKLCEFYNTPGFCDEYTHLFLAIDLEDVRAAPR